jgi:hypothetical protein
MACAITVTWQPACRPYSWELQALASRHAQQIPLASPCRTQATVGAEDGDDEAAGASYQLDMMRCLREVNVDNNTVGWCEGRVGGAVRHAQQHAVLHSTTRSCRWQY